MNDQKQAVISKLKGANNILVTVSANPSVDQLAACIGLTIMLNKLKKHATAVFSGAVPSTLDFLKPDDTLEKNTDSLRDFIISLDKSKADKLRYKVEENVVKIFITPYRTSINQDDLDFSQGDFNVDVVLALGVHQQEDLDQAITMHGRILHDATVMSVNTVEGAELGSINWTDKDTSSLSELAVVITDELGKDLMDSQIATALLTGIVAETERFSNEKTSPETMRLSAELLTAGANQQLVASELEEPEVAPATSPDQSATHQDQPPKPEDGTLEIAHSGEAPAKPSLPEQFSELPPVPDNTAVHDVKQNNFEDETPKSQLPPPHYLSEPQVGTGQFDPNDDTDDSFIGTPQDTIPLLERNKPATPTEPPVVSPPEPPHLDEAPKPADVTFQPLDSEPAEQEVPTPPEPPKPNNQITIDPNGNIQGLAPMPAPTPPADSAGAPGGKTLTEIEEAVHSPHVRENNDSETATADTPTPPAGTDLDAARDAVMSAINNAPSSAPAPTESVGASGYLNVQELSGANVPPPGPASASQAPIAPLPPEPVSPPAGTATPSQPWQAPFVSEPTPGNTPADTPLTMPLPPSMPLPPPDVTPPTTPSTTATPPPPVPPPFMPQNS